jgi:hypothetical protein
MFLHEKIGYLPTSIMDFANLSSWSWVLQNCHAVKGHLGFHAIVSVCPLLSFRVSAGFPCRLFFWAVCSVCSTGLCVFLSTD